MEIYEEVAVIDDAAAIKKAYFRGWYENNKEKHLAYMTTKIKCECGTEVNRNYMKKHLTTASHKNNMLKAGITKCACGAIVKLKNINFHLTTATHRNKLASLK